MFKLFIFIIIVYIDNIPFIGLNEIHIAIFKVEVHATFELSNFDPLHHYLGIHFLQCDGGIALC